METRDEFLARMQAHAAHMYERCRSVCETAASLRNPSGLHDYAAHMQQGASNAARLERMARGVQDHDDFDTTLQFARLNECHCWGQP